MLNRLKKYDKRLYFNRKLDWSIDILRKSQFIRNVEYTVFTISNQYVGSGKWVIDKLKLMDSHHINFFDDVIRKNLTIRNKKSDPNMHKDVAWFIRDWQKIIL